MSTFRDLEATLLAVGGERVLAQPEPHLDILVGRGRRFSARGRKRLAGVAHKCHANSALYYAMHHALGFGGACQLVTGYGLYQEGTWCQHSWLWDGSRVLETNTEPVLYFGVALTPEEALGFLLANVLVYLPGAGAAVESAVGRRRGRTRAA